VCDVYIEGRIQQRAGEVARGPRSARAVLHRCLVCLRISDEFAQIPRGQILAASRTSGV
jgi:hypothetical protein